MGDAFEHEREALAVAACRNTLLCSPHRVGKTFVAAMRVREWLHAAPSSSAAIAVAVAPTPHARDALHAQIQRMCSEPLWIEPRGPRSAAAEAELLDAFVAARARVAVLSPKLLQSLLRKTLLHVREIGLLVLEDADEIHETAPSLFRQALEPIHIVGGTAHHSAGGAALPSILATTRTPASQLAWDPQQNPLFRHVHVLSVMPVVAPDAVQILHGHAPPPLPLLLAEPFDRVPPAAASSSAPTTTLSCAVRDFLLGENDRHVDFVRVFRLELELGNSAAVYDEKKKQERVNRFIADAESVYEHLGMWCLLKYVELELQANLHACLVEDVDNINRRKRGHLLEKQRLSTGAQVDTGGAAIDQGPGEDVADEDGDDDEDEETEHESSPGKDSLAALIESSAVNMDDVKMAKIKYILKMLALLASAATALSARAASPRLLKVTSVARSQLSMVDITAVSGDVEDPVVRRPRCWVFVERRAHCNVVAEYLSFALADLGIPPCCSMLGHSNARVVGALHFSSYSKVIRMFASGQTNVLVTTSIAKKSQRLRTEPPLCDLVIVMDELLEADKLLDYCHRAFPTNGVVKYVLPRGRADVKKFQLLLRKLREVALLDAAGSDHIAQQSASTTPLTSTAARYGHFEPRQGDCGAHAPLVDLLVSGQSASAVGTAASASAVPAHSVAAASRPSPAVTASRPAPTPPAEPAVTYELVHKDTGAVLNLENSMQILSAFCNTLPGLDTYDRRLQYYIKRHQIAGPGMSASLKQAKKKKLQYNSKLYDKIDDLKAQAEARATADGDDMNTTDTVTGSDTTGVARFQYTAKLRLPVMVGVKKEIGSPKVWSDTEAKAIVAFKGCQELLKRGLLDRHFRSKLECDPQDTSGDMDLDTTVYVDDEDAKPSTSDRQQLADLSAQNSYDLPPVSAAEMGLATMRSLLVPREPSAIEEGEASAANDEPTIPMCFYGIQGNRFAILCTKELYTGCTNTGWRYKFATSSVMDATVTNVTLQKAPTRLHLTKSQLEEALHFHLIMMRLACMTVDDALREVDIKGAKIWDEFSEQNDKGYVVVPSKLVDGAAAGDRLALDWEYLRKIIGKPLLVDCWPLPAPEGLPMDEWICVPTHRRNVRYVARALTRETAGEAIKPMAEIDSAWAAHYKTKAVAGIPIFGRWHSRDQVKEADADQPLIHAVQIPEIVPLIRRVMQRNHDDASIAQSKAKFQERYMLPQYTSLLRLTKTEYFEAMGIVPLLYEFERKCQMSNLMTKMGLEVDLTLLDDATTKPAYERLEILGDTFLKLETTWYLYENRKDVAEEGSLTRMRRDIIRNDRLTMFALANDLHRYILYPAEIEQHPFKCWKPSCMGKTPDSIVASSKWVADVLEAICGACLVSGHEQGGRHFLKWVSVSVPVSPHTYATEYWPNCVPGDLPEDSPDAVMRRGDLGFRVDRLDAVDGRVVAMQQRLKYTFQNKLLLLEALTHPSVGVQTLQYTKTGESVRWRGNYERLEYLGDAVIEYLTLAYAYQTYPKWLPGSLSQWKSATVSNDALGKTAISRFGVDECILTGAVKIDRESLEIVAKLPRKYPRDAALTQSATELLRRGGGGGGRKSAAPPLNKRKTPAATAVNALALPKMFADVFEALVAAVFLDSNYNLRTVRDVFLGPLLETVGEDARAYVCRESGLALDDDSGNGLGGDPFDGRVLGRGGSLLEGDDMEVLRLSPEDDDDDLELRP